MISLNLPTYNTKIKQRLDGSYDIFDFLRKRYVRLTPEEWVRQHFVHYLVELKGYPSALLQNENQSAAQWQPTPLRYGSF